ncbi:hypothetical protein BDZ94DRAFT_1187314 [Collybia nuda]|uniref:LysM domain-containing protein n=1 Tax=Collybia nuda TaxID=64659 RepID=A0A9P5YEW3_9AGAR|nr:hypothetical protein BDZ94DRAFT_1187314 [Collybia nuda]
MKSPALYLTNTIRAEIDRNTTLCLACASSLPPLKTSTDLHGESPVGTQDVFITHCCGRPICPRCITANPRLERYNPCLVCLGGVGVVRSGSNTPVSPHMNVDGAMRDEDVFVLGDEDEDTDCENKQSERNIQLVPQRPTPVDLEHGNDHSTLRNTADKISTELPTLNYLSPSKYYITRTDTLQGIALRFGLDGREICRLNNLPPSTLSTTPHLLHTRMFLTLPPSTHYRPGLINSEEERKRETQDSKKRAEKRLQTVTKEVDWRVAKAYIALAEDPPDEVEEAEDYSRKRKEAGVPSGPSHGHSNLEERAIEQYLDDDEWEATQRRDGGKIGPFRFPLAKISREGASLKEKKRGGDRRWWQWEL